MFALLYLKLRKKMRTFSCPLIILSLDLFNTPVAIENSSFSTVEVFNTLSFIQQIFIAG